MISAEEAYSHYNKDWSIVCERVGVSTYKFTHYPSGEEYLVEYSECYDTCRILKDKYNGMPHDPVPVIQEEDPLAQLLEDETE